MIDLNYILLFVAITSPVAILIGALRSGASPSWRIAAVLVLAISGTAWMLVRNEAGYVGGGVWLTLLFLPAVGLRRVAELCNVHHYRSARKLATALQLLHPSREVRRQIAMLRDFESQQASGLVPPPLESASASWIQFSNRLDQAPVVVLLIGLNVAMFLVELRYGAAADSERLLRLGALYPSLVTREHQYWRLLTTVFLHYGTLHLFFNIFALYVLGPALERAIGGVRFLACYLISGVGSSAGVVLLTSAHVLAPAELAGASGCVMGVVGAWAGYLVRHRHIPDARRRLNNVFMIVGVQTIFDLMTPQVSMSAHLCGLMTGFVLGLFMAPQPIRQT